MILILLVASLEYELPCDFIRDVLNFTSLNKIGAFYDSIEFFELPRICRVYISNLLLSAVKIDRDQKLVKIYFQNIYSIKAIFYILGLTEK
jgi:hypothetical protein